LEPHNARSARGNLPAPVLDPRSVIELALVHRLASLLWRIRRASAIETGVLEMHGELLPARPQDPSRGPDQPGMLQTAGRANGHKTLPAANKSQDPLASTSMRRAPAPWSKGRAIAQCFLRLSNLDPTLLDRVGCYEARLWRQAVQTIWTLEVMRRPPPAPKRFRQPMVRSYWDAEYPRMR
jgi:hypothetical protein